MNDQSHADTSASSANDESDLALVIGGIALGAVILGLILIIIVA